MRHVNVKRAAVFPLFSFLVGRINVETRLISLGESTITKLSVNATNPVSDLKTAIKH